MSLGDVQAFIQYSRQFTFPIIQAASIANVLQSAVASAERVFELLDEPEEIADPVAPAAAPRPGPRPRHLRGRRLPLRRREAAHRGPRPGRRARPDRRHRRPDRRRQDHAREPADALLRRRPGPDHRRRDRHPGADAGRPAPDVRDGPAGRVAVQGHDPRERRVRRPGRARRGEVPARRSRPRTWTTSCGRCPTATRPCSTTTRPTCRPARSSCSRSPARSSPTRRSSSSTRPPRRWTRGPRCSSRRR